MTTKVIRIPAERAQQLKQIAAGFGTTMAALIGDWINREIAAGNLPDQIPGVGITALHGEVYLELDGHPIGTMPAEAATDVADRLERVANVGGAFMDMDSNNLAVRRVGLALLISATAKSGATVRRTLTSSVALDVVRIIRTAAQQAA